MDNPSASIGTASLAKELARELIANPDAHAPSLRVVRGPQVAPCILPRPPSMVTIGRGETATWQLTDASVSREQCVVERTDVGTYVTDASQRGTQVGGTLVTGKVGPLVSGQTISFGNVVIVYEESSRGQQVLVDDQATLVAAAKATPAVTPTPMPMPWWWWALMVGVAASLGWIFY